MFPDRVADHQGAETLECQKQRVLCTLSSLPFCDPASDVFSERVASDTQMTVTTVYIAQKARLPVPPCKVAAVGKLLNRYCRRHHATLPVSSPETTCPPAMTGDLGWEEVGERLHARIPLGIIRA